MWWFQPENYFCCYIIAVKLLQVRITMKIVWGIDICWRGHKEQFENHCSRVREICGTFLAPATLVPWARMSWTHFPNTGWAYPWGENRGRTYALSCASHSVKWGHHTAHVLIWGSLVIIPPSNTSQKFLRMWQTNVDVCNWNYRLALNSDIILSLSCECLRHAHLSKIRISKGSLLLEKE